MASFIFKRLVRPTHRYEWFYSVDNVYDSYLDPQTLLPVKTEKSISEGSYYLYEEVRYDRLNGKAFSKKKEEKRMNRLTK